jgi:hypothetical protein
MTKSHEIDWPPQDECARFEKTLEFVARRANLSWLVFCPRRNEDDINLVKKFVANNSSFAFDRFSFFSHVTSLPVLFSAPFFLLFLPKQFISEVVQPTSSIFGRVRNPFVNPVVDSFFFSPSTEKFDTWHMEVRKKTTMSRSRPSRDAKRPIPNLNRPLCAYQGFKQGVARCFIKTHLNMPHVNRRWVITCNNKTVASTAKSTCKGVIERNADGGKLKVPPPGGHLERVVFRS